MIKRIQILMCSLMVVINPCLVAMKEEPAPPPPAWIKAAKSAGHKKGQKCEPSRWQKISPPPISAPNRSIVSHAIPIHVMPMPESFEVGNDFFYRKPPCLALKNGNIVVVYGNGVALFDASQGYQCVQQVEIKKFPSCLVEVDEGRIAFVQEVKGKHQLKIFGDDTVIDLPQADFRHTLFLGDGKIILAARQMEGNDIFRVSLRDESVTQLEKKQFSACHCLVKKSAESFMAFGFPHTYEALFKRLPQQCVVFDDEFNVQSTTNFDVLDQQATEMFGDLFDDSSYESLTSVFLIKENLYGFSSNAFFILEPETLVVKETFGMGYLDHIAVNDKGLLAYLRREHFNGKYEKIYIRDLTKFQEQEIVIPLEGFLAINVTVTDDNKLLVSCSDGAVRVWDLKDVLAEAC